MTSSKAIRSFCKQCVSSSRKKDIQNCGGEMVLATRKPCALFKYRLKGRGDMRAIRKNCLECMGGSSNAVADCTTKSCDLYTFRFGKRTS